MASKERESLRKALWACGEAVLAGRGFVVTGGEQVALLEEGVRAGLAALREPVEEREVLAALRRIKYSDTVAAGALATATDPELCALAAALRAAEGGNDGA